MCTLSSFPSVSLRTLTRYQGYARNRVCALPSLSPFHYVMAKIVPAMQLAAHAKSSFFTVGLTVASPNFFVLTGDDRLLLFAMISALQTPL